MNSATACLHAACISVEPLPWEEIIVSPYTFASSATCVLMANAKPVFVDIEDETFCMNPEEIKKAMTPQTKAIIPVHLMGHPAEMDAIMEIAQTQDIVVIEDAAQAIGALYKGKYVGTIGNCGIFSFNQSKQISTGEGGMLITNNDYIARVAKAVRNHGEVSDPEFGLFGYNYRLCEIEAYLALSQFERLEAMQSHRTLLTTHLTHRLKSIRGITPPIVKDYCTHAWYTYAAKFDETEVGMSRDTFQDELIKRDIYFGKGYVKPLYFLPVFRDYATECPVAERMWRELIVLDWLRYPATLEDVDLAADTMEEIIRTNHLR